MAVKPILRMGHPVLRVPAAPYPVSEIDTPEFAALIQNLRDTLVDAGGIGLAAPQIGFLTKWLSSTFLRVPPATANSAP